MPGSLVPGNIPGGGPSPAAVTIREVGPRDGLQSERPVAPEERAQLTEHLANAGCRRIEVVSFVSERAVPAMAGAASVMATLAALPELGASVRLTALVPNLRGAEAALETAVAELTVTISASPTYNEKNVHRTIPESLAEVERVTDKARSAGVPVDAVVSCAFGSPYEGEVDLDELAVLTRRLVESGASTITLADTTGMATPRVLALVTQAVSAAVPPAHADDLGLHLHETRQTGLLNAFAALGLGITRFDTSVGGLGGSPFATGAGGNLATEALVALLDDLGIETGIDLDRLFIAAVFAGQLVGHEVPCPLSRTGPRLRPAAEPPAASGDDPANSAILGV